MEIEIELTSKDYQEAIYLHQGKIFPVRNPVVVQVIVILVLVLNLGVCIQVNDPNIISIAISFLLLIGGYLLYKASGINNLDPMKLFDVSQMGVPGDNEIRFPFKRTRKEFVVRWIISNPVSSINIFCNDSLSENKAEETSKCFIFGFKSLFDPGILEYTTYLFHYFNSLFTLTS